MSLPEISPSLQSAKENIQTCRASLDPLTRVVGITTVLATFLIVMGVIMITGALLCLTLPKVQVMKQLVRRIIIPSAIAMLASIPLILLSRKSNVELQACHRFWVKNLVLILEKETLPQPRKAFNAFAAAHLFKETDGKDFNQELVKRVGTAMGCDDKDPLIKKLNEAVAKIYQVKGLSEDPDDDLSDDDDEKKVEVGKADEKRS